MRIEKEYGKSKTYYPNSKLAGNAEAFDRAEWRKNTVDFIVSHPAAKFFKHFPLVIEFGANDTFIWNREKLECEDDISLIFKSNICRNTDQLTS